VNQFQLQFKVKMIQALIIIQLGLHFRLFFHKLIWSPWPATGLGKQAWPCCWACWGWASVSRTASIRTCCQPSDRRARRSGANLIS
jgi:hypothetical protein